MSSDPHIEPLPPEILACVKAAGKSYTHVLVDDEPWKRAVCGNCGWEGIPTFIDGEAQLECPRRAAIGCHGKVTIIEEPHHPDPEINAEVEADVGAAEAYDRSVGL